MRAITFEGPKRVQVTQVPDPRLVDPTDAIVRVEMTAICGSDLHVYHGRETGLDRGCVLGHEFLGEVVEAGPESGVAVGSRVVSPFTTSCGGCYFCAAGLTSRCERGQLFGWVADGLGLQGAQAEFVRVPLARTSLVEIPDGVASDAALFVGDILATGWHCAANAPVTPGAVACVVGCGPVGLLAAVAARELGAERVFAIDGVPDRRQLARSFGAEPLAPEDALESIRAATYGRGADVVLEAVGSGAALSAAVELVRFGGVVSSVGVQTDRQFAISPIAAYDKNLTVKFGRCPARHYAERLLEWLRDPPVDVARLVSHRMPLSDGVRAYDLFDRKLDGCTKVILAP